MDITEEMLASDPYKKRIQRFSSEALRVMLKNRPKAVEYARKAIKDREPDNLTDEYVEAMVDEAQKLAQIILEQRAKKHKYPRNQSIKPKLKDS